MRNLLLMLLFLSSVCLDISALQIVPFIHSFDPDDKNENTFQYYIENKTDGYMAFELSVFRRYQDKNGKDILKKDTKSFRLMPSQIIIPPNSQRSVKVKWIGNKDYKGNPNIEQAFRVSMTQFPINLNKKRTRIKGASLEVVYEIKTSLYASPKNAKPDLRVAEQNSHTIALRNDGSKRAEVQYCDLSINGKKITSLIRSDEINTVVMPGNTRIFHRIEEKETLRKSS